MVEQGLDHKTINPLISKVARGFFMSKLDEEAGL